MEKEFGQVNELGIQKKNSLQWKQEYVRAEELATVNALRSERLVHAHGHGDRFFDPTQPAKT